MKYLLILVLSLLLTACVATEDGFIMRTADPALGIQFSFPTEVVVSGELPPLPGESGVDEPAVLPEDPTCEFVKGNISQDGRKLYHIPGMPNYNQVKIDESKGEMFFCDVESAEAAGWVKAGG